MSCTVCGAPTAPGRNLCRSDVCWDRNDLRRERAAAVADEPELVKCGQCPERVRVLDDWGTCGHVMCREARLKQDMGWVKGTTMRLGPGERLADLEAEL